MSVVSDPIADMLTRIRNAGMARRTETTMPSSKILVEIAKILQQEGYIRGWEVQESKPFNDLIVYLKYAHDRRHSIRNIRRVSKPGLRVYTKADKVPRVLGGLGVAVLSTSQGLMTDREARKRKVGGEVLCFVW